MTLEVPAETTSATAAQASSPRWSGVALMVGSGLSNQVGASIAALAFPVLGPVGVVAVRQWVAAVVLLSAGRPNLRTFTAAQWRPVLGLAAVFATMNLTLYAAIDRIGLGFAVTLEFLGPLAVALASARRRINIRPLLDALDLQEDAARALADDLSAQIGDLQTRLREAEMHLEHFAITRKTVTGLADQLPAVAPDLPEHPDYPRILAAFNHATGPLRAKDVCEALGRELLPKNVEGTRAKLKRLVKLGILTEADTGNFARKQ
ncbi:hypothetical protein ACFPH6_21320 [Streptomyces xiangluensis]|uniref:Uncharacterized protein n=1 Tax=Streptomyces xiangluensis TaxID=2665720 RepID=A0ABV8YS12_9ACTN